MEPEAEPALKPRPPHSWNVSLKRHLDVRVKCPPFNVIRKDALFYGVPAIRGLVILEWRGEFLGSLRNEQSFLSFLWGRFFLLSKQTDKQESRG